MNTPRTYSPSYLDNHDYQNISSTSFTSTDFTTSPALSPNSLLSSPGFEETFTALDEECNDIERAFAALEEESRGNQERMSPFPSPTGFSHPIIQNLVSPENLISLMRNRQRSLRPRTPPLKKRHLIVNPHQRHNEQRQEQQKRTKNKRISLTVPNLLMGLKYSTNSIQLTDRQTSCSNSTNSGAKTKREENFSLLGQGSLTTRKRKRNSKMNDFPLPSLKKAEYTDSMNKTMNATYNNNNIIAKKAPSLVIFRRKWDSLSNRKGHINEHKMSKAEQKQLLRESFFKTICFNLKPF